ncbi:MAG: four helix bundle protein [Opitutaceae bacterium]|nr:four helix bundle protein [Opitutaceae bacterium]
MSQTYRQLQVWQRSKALAVVVYRFTGRPPIKTDFGLRDQMRRAAISVCSNIAEGDARQGGKECAQFFYIAKGSLSELSAQLEIAVEIYPTSAPQLAPLLQECDELSAMLQALINHRRN